MRPSTSSTSASGWQRFSQVYGAPCATTRSTFSRQSFSAFVTAGTTCSGWIWENGGSEKGVSNGLVISAVLLNEVNEARIRRCAYLFQMGVSVVNFNGERSGKIPGSAALTGLRVICPFLL